MPEIVVTKLLCDPCFEAGLEENGELISVKVTERGQGEPEVILDTGKILCGPHREIIRNLTAFMTGKVSHDLIIRAPVRVPEGWSGEENPPGPATPAPPVVPLVKREPIHRGPGDVDTVCSRCGQTVRYIYRAQHAHRSHDVEVWEIDWVFPANTYTVSCEECGLKVLSGAGLSRHEKVHGPGKPTSRGLEVVCTECIPHLVLQFGSLGSHAKSVHEKDQFHLKWYFSGISVSELHFCKHPLRGGGECTMKYPTFGGLIMHQRNAQHKNKDNELLWAKLRMEGKAEEPEVIPA